MQAARGEKKTHHKPYRNVLSTNDINDQNVKTFLKVQQWQLYLGGNQELCKQTYDLM